MCLQNAAPGAAFEIHEESFLERTGSLPLAEIVCLSGVERFGNHRSPMAAKKHIG